ncbi:hypothetical protein PROPEN_03126 [Proteus penneri ATCC 35198]|nr:hypothetical protein PROPEN_03126 [Proteus penneri ATCC 35198]
MKKIVLATVLASLFFGSAAMAESKTAFSLPAIEKSAEGGNAASQYQLGVKYENGEGVEQDAQKRWNGISKLLSKVTLKHS